MDRISRKTQYTFAGDLVAQNNIAKFGSLRIGAAAYSLDPDEIQTDEYMSGWSAALQANKAPALQDMNALGYLWSRQIGYLMQQGVPEWDTNTTYYIGSIVADGVTGKMYSSIVDTNTSNAVSDFAKWKPHGPSIPIGGVIATFPHLSGAYVTTATSVADAEGFVKCNGQQITDVTSPMAGVTIPNINNDVFLMGNTTSVTAASSSTTKDLSHTHTLGNLPAHTHGLDSTGFAAIAVDSDGIRIRRTSASNTFTNNIVGYGTGQMYSSQTQSGERGAELYGVTATISSAPSLGTPGTSLSAVFDVRPKYISAVYLMRVK